MSLFHALDDKTLLAGMRRIAGNIRLEQVRGLQHLAEIEARKAYVPEGYSSLWSYCRDDLKLSESVISRWTRAMKVTRQYPEILERLADGRLSLCAVAMLEGHLNDDNWRRVTSQAEGCNKLAVMELVAALAPKPAMKDVIVPLKQAAMGVAADSVNGPETRADQKSSGGAQENIEVASRPHLAPQATIKAQAPEVWRIAFDASAATKKKLERLKELRAGQSLDDSLGEALEVLLNKIDPERRHKRREARRAHKKSQRSEQSSIEVDPRETPDQTSGVDGTIDGASVIVPPVLVLTRESDADLEIVPSRPRKKIAASTRDAVKARDGSRCVFVAASGRRCDGRAFTDLDHVVPLAFGGTDEGSNLRVLCKSHHKLVTREVFGTQCC